MIERPRTIFSEDHEIFRQSVRRFVETELVPHHAAWEDAGIVPREAWRKAGDAGLLCCDIPESYGGPGGDFGHCAVVTEELARANLSGPGFVVHSDMVATYVAKFGSEEQKAAWLPGMVDGTRIAAIAMTEPDAGSDLKAMRTRAERVGDDYVITGQKTYISNGQNAHMAIVACKTDPAAGAQGISLIAVETDRTGFRPGRNLRKLGMHAQDTSELFFDGVRVPVANRLGAEGQGFGMLMTNLARERLVQAIRGTVIAEQVIRWTVQHTREVAIAGIGETPYYRHGQSPDPEFKLVLKAILAACADAAIDPREIDGFASYANDRSDPARLAAALGVRQLRSATLQWGGGGGGCAAAVANGAAAIATGMARVVVVYRGLAQGQFGRFGQGGAEPTVAGEMAWQMPYGVIAPPQKFAFRVRRFMHDHGVQPEALRAIALASYHHAQANPRAVMQGKPLDAERYEASRWIVEPFRLYDCCMENDGAAAVLLLPAARAKAGPRPPAYLLGAAAGGDFRSGAHPHNAPDYATANFKTVAADLYAMARLGPADVGSVQSYENFTGGAS
jgi:alkylation response protein AidB-like acyl-CoA dehydrogenase